MDFIVNPAAGRGDYMRTIGKIKSRFTDAKIIITKAPGDATVISRRLANEGADLLVAVGGDGSAAETAAGILTSENKNARLGILPVGTGNDLARSLGIKEDLNFAFETLARGNCKNIDVIRVNDGYCLNIASLGMDTEIVAYQMKIKKTFKKFSYYASIIKNIFTFKPFEAKIRIDDQEISGRFTLAAIANGERYGRGVKIAPGARLDDGLILLCLIRAMPNIKMAFVFPKAVKGTHGTLPEVAFYPAKRIVIEADALAGIDGNILPRVKTHDFSILKGALTTIVPFDNREELI